MNQELRDFVREALIRGMPRPEVREKLLAAGWRREEVEIALGAFAEVESPIPVPRRRPYLSAREAFFYLVLFVTLYITAFNVGSLLFQLLNRALPDLTEIASSWDAYSAEAARRAIAGVVIAFPIFLFMSRLIGRTMLRDPEKRASKIRKWLTYITLFVSACVIIGDLTFLVTQVLSGELALRVGLKVLAVLLIAGVIFARYLTDLRREEERAQLEPPRPSTLARVAGVGALAALIFGLLAVGSPQDVRFRKIDAERLGDLMRIEGEITGYYRDHRGLPSTLDALMELPASNVRRVKDPATGVPYGYRIVDSTTYELSAIFYAADSISERYDHGTHFWRHPAGPHRYTITIPPAQGERPPAPAPIRG